MDWITGLQRAIDYIEENITEDIDYEKVAAVSFSSSYHFQRVFSILCGYTVGEYIRFRRLSLAGAELAGGGEKVIDVALKYGYDTPDSFSRAFQKFHGISPSKARIDGSLLKSFSRLAVKISLEGGDTMNYRIEEKDEMVLTGYKRRFVGAPGERGEQECDMYVTTRALQYILQRLSGDVENNMDVITNIDDEGYDFYIAYQLEERYYNNLSDKQVLGEEFAKYFENITIPKGTYAIFETERCKAPTRIYLDLRRKVVSEWLPGSGYQIANAPELVVTHWFRGEKSNQRYRELWIPVEKSNLLNR
ncbi:MAG: AraC family transcriptional regulator [Oscillospiraceae bacterium]|nr:AraC family transcriptional regulator [Oscillospiraceae bacterium]